MPEGIVVGLGGYLRSGKDTVADYLVSEYGFVKMGMSDPLHEMMMEFNPFIEVTDVEFCDDDRFVALNDYTNNAAHSAEYRILSYGWMISYSGLTEALGYVEAKKIKGYREALQKFGTDVVRNMIDENTWVKLAQKRIREQTEQGKNVVMTAIRFKNEVRLMHKVDAATLWINRPGTGGESMHASENNVSYKDFGSVVENDDTLDRLYSEVDLWLEEAFPDGFPNNASEAGDPFDGIF